MHNSDKSWESRLWATIRKVVGKKATDDIELQWQKHQALEKPVVTLFGSYDSGKSTLLKRLLVDSGVAVPDWLTIAARRDTFEVNEVGAMGCLYRDTPGIASGNDEHEIVTRESLITTDVIVVVLPPQLITGDLDKILAVVSGEMFRAGGVSLRDSLAFAMCKMDEGGYDPVDNPEEYQKYLKNKSHELQNIMERSSVDIDPKKIFGIAADPFQTVLNIKNPNRTAYNSSRDWDGLNSFQEWIESLPHALPNLRALARQRFLYAIAEAHKLVVSRRLEDLRLGLQETKANEDRFDLLLQQLDALVRKARTDLEATIEEELTTAATAHLTGISAIEKFALPRLKNAVSRWEDDNSAELDKLISSADAEIEARKASAGAEKVQDLFEEKQSEERGTDLQSKKKIVASLLGQAQSAVKSYHEKSLGMKLDKAREELKKLDGMKNFQEYLKTTKGSKRFTDPLKADAARKIVSYHTIVDTASPFLLELGAMLWEEKQRLDLEKSRANRRQELREKIRKVAAMFSDSAWQTWEIRSNQLKAWLLEHKKGAVTQSKTLEDEIKIHKGSSEELSQLLAN